jgi:phosphoribosylanthranilate isomerase
MAAPRIKICGIMNLADARAAAELGVDAIGLNFYSGSPRYVQPDAAERILRALPPFIEPVGVFVDQPLRDAFAAINVFSAIRTVQWYGDRPEMCDAYPFRYIPTFPVRDRDSLRSITSYLDLCRGLNKLPTAIAVDAHAPGQYGGTGRPIPWDILAGFQPGVPLILAGGLTPENVAEAIRIVRPYAVDVASGVESGAGTKDGERMRRFVEGVRGT